MDCEKIKELLSRYIDHQLDADDRGAVEKHLESCPDCTAHYEKLLALGRMADEFDVEADDAYWEGQKDAVIDRIEQVEAEKIVPMAKRGYRNVFYKLAAVAATVALIAYVSIDVSKEIETTRGVFQHDESMAPQMVKPELDENVRRVAEPDTLRGVSAPAENARSGMVFESISTSSVKDKKDKGEKEVVDQPVKMMPKITTPKPVSDDVPIDEDKAVTVTREEQMFDVSRLKGQVHSDAVEKAPAGLDLPEPETVDELGTATKPIIEKKDAGKQAVVCDSPAMEAVQMQVISAESEAGKGPSVHEYMAMYDVEVQNAELNERGLDPDYFDGFTGPQIATYLNSYDRVGNLKKKYPDMFASAGPAQKSRAGTKLYAVGEIPDKGAYEMLSIDSLNIVINDMADAFYQLGKVTPIDDERDLMLEYLDRLRGEADTSATRGIDDYIDDLESISK